MAEIDSESRHARSFATTRWTMVLAAGRNVPGASHALATLCEQYWYPLYAYVRRRGFNPDDARDLTQEFFAHLLSTDGMSIADPERGKFRSFLLSSLNNFLTNQWRKEHAQKRGGGQRHLSFDLEAGESRYAAEPGHALTPERIYERRWALTVLDQVVASLREEYEAGGKLPLFDELKPYLGGNSEGLPYADLAKRIGMTEGSIKVAVHRLRRRCGELLRSAIAETVNDPTQVDDELAYLFTALQNSSGHL